MSNWDEYSLRKIIAKQKAAIVNAKRLNLKKPLQQILVIIDNFNDADSKKFVWTETFQRKVEHYENLLKKY